MELNCFKNTIILMFSVQCSVSPDVDVGPAVAPAVLTWDNGDDDVVVAAVAAAAAVVVTTVTAMVGLVPGVVFPLLNINIIYIIHHPPSYITRCGSVQPRHLRPSYKQRSFPGKDPSLLECFEIPP